MRRFLIRQHDTSVTRGLARSNGEVTIYIQSPTGLQPVSYPDMSYLEEKCQQYGHTIEWLDEAEVSDES